VEGYVRVEVVYFFTGKFVGDEEGQFFPAGGAKRGGV
jgi:hypothetical protein